MRTSARRSVSRQMLKDKSKAKRRKEKWQKEKDLGGRSYGNAPVKLFRSRRGAVHGARELWLKTWRESQCSGRRLKVMLCSVVHFLSFFLCASKERTIKYFKVINHPTWRGSLPGWRFVVFCSVVSFFIFFFMCCLYVAVFSLVIFFVVMSSQSLW